MFKKMVLVGILLVALLVLSGCGTYNVDFKGDNNHFSYGGFKVPYVGGADDQCTQGHPEFKSVGKLCLAVGDENRCKSLPLGSPLDPTKVIWTSRNVPKYAANFCVLSCELEVDSCGKKAVCYGLPDKSMNICSPYCTSDADCLPGLTSCKEIFGSKFCVPNDDLSKAPVFKLPSEPVPPSNQNELMVEFDLRPGFPSHDYPTLPHGSGGMLYGGEPFWVDVYLISNSRNTLAGTTLEFSSPQLSFVPFGDPDFEGAVEFEGAGGKVLPYSATFSGTTTDKAVIKYDIGLAGATPILAKTRIYLASIKASIGHFSGGGPITFTLGQNSVSLYEKDLTKKYNLKVGRVRGVSVSDACVYIPSDFCKERCGIVQNGCGGLVDCSLPQEGGFICSSNEVCISNKCQPAISLALPVDAPQKNKDLLKGVVNSLQTNKDDAVNALLDVFTALNTWLKS